MISRFLVFLLKSYKKYISPHLGNHCRFTPTCSEYAITAIERFGPFRGSLMTFFRLVRCNPLFKGGYDPVPEKDRKLN